MLVEAASQGAPQIGEQAASGERNERPRKAGGRRAALEGPTGVQALPLPLPPGPAGAQGLGSTVARAGARAGGLQAALCTACCGRLLWGAADDEASCRHHGRPLFPRRSADLRIPTDQLRRPASPRSQQPVCRGASPCGTWRPLAEPLRGPRRKGSDPLAQCAKRQGLRRPVRSTPALFLPLSPPAASSWAPPPAWVARPLLAPR